MSFCTVSRAPRIAKYLPDFFGKGIHAGALICGVMLLAGVLTLNAPAAAQEAEPLKLKTVEKEPPGDFDASIKEVLSNKCVQLVGEEGPVLEFWLRDPVPLQSAPGSVEGSLDAIAPTTLVGVVRATEQQRDYRDDEIFEGMYTMRYATLPQDGNHMGVAPFRYFVLLTPPFLDEELDSFDAQAALEEASLEDTASAHPVNMSLRPVDSAEGEFPRLTEPDEETKAMAIKLTGKSSEGKHPLVFELVYKGHGEL